MTFRETKWCSCALKGPCLSAVVGSLLVVCLFNLSLNGTVLKRKAITSFPSYTRLGKFFFKSNIDLEKCEGKGGVLAPKYTSDAA